MTWNIQGLRKHSDSVQLKQFLQTFDIVGLVETWSDFSGEFDSFLDNYKHYDFVRQKSESAFRNSGGVSVFVKNEWLLDNMISRIYHGLNDCVVLHIKSRCYKEMKDFILYIAYVSPEGSSIYSRLDGNNGICMINDNISKIKQDFPDCYLYLAGDLNARTKTL